MQENFLIASVFSLALQRFWVIWELPVMLGHSEREEAHLEKSVLGKVKAFVWLWMTFAKGAHSLHSVLCCGSAELWVNKTLNAHFCVGFDEDDVQSLKGNLQLLGRMKKQGLRVVNSSCWNAGEQQIVQEFSKRLK